MAHSNQEATTSNYPDENTSEIEDEVRIILPSSKYKDIQNPPRIPQGIVISGEASESDEEIDTHQAIPQSTSDFSISDTWERSTAEIAEKDASKDSSIQYNTLLHKKLREKNQTLRRDIVELVTQPYESATKEIHNISQQLIKSQLLVQKNGKIFLFACIFRDDWFGLALCTMATYFRDDSEELRSTIRRLTNDLFDMEDKMEALRTGSFLPDISGSPAPDQL